jgi:hypothetical protein
VDGTVRFLNLELLFAASLDKLEESHLQHAVDAQFPEESNLDFKRGLYAEDKKLDLAVDVAALANAQGGVIILGVGEVNGRAASLHPLELREAEDRRMREIVARNTAPVPDLRVRHIRSAGDPTQGYYLLVVPRSPYAPHAVRVGQESLRYPRRYGAQTLYMPETEVASAYRNRFLEATEQVARLNQVHEDGLDRIRPRSAGVASSGWLTLALVPNTPGTMDIRLNTLPDFEAWARSGGSAFDTPFRRSSVSASTGVRRVSITAWQDSQSGLPKGAYGEFHTDGSAFVAGELNHTPVLGNETLRGVSDEAVVALMIGLVHLVVDHAASRTGAVGDAVVLASLVGSRFQTESTPEPGIALVHNRQYGWELLPRTRPLSRLPTSRHTISVDAAAASVQERLVAARLVLTDLVQGFGLAEVLQITPDGALRARYWRESVEQWTTAAGIQTVTTTLEEEAG